MATHWVLNTLPPENSLRQHLGSFAEHGPGSNVETQRAYEHCGGSSPQLLHSPTSLTRHSPTSSLKYKIITLRPGLPTQSQVSHTVHVVNMARTCCPCMCSCADRSRWLYWMHRHTCTRAADCLLDVLWSVCNLLLEHAPTGIACHLLLEHFMERAYEDLKLVD